MTNPPLPGGIACGASHVRPGELQIALEAIRGPASDQRCAAVLINGAVGIGKSTLLDEIIHAFANRGIRTLAAKPSHEESRMSFATLNDLGVSVLDQPIIGREHTRLRGMGAVRAEAVALVTTLATTPWFHRQRSALAQLGIMRW